MKNTAKISIIVFLFCAILAGCSDKKADPAPTQLLLNVAMENGTTSPDNWTTSGFGDYTSNWTKEQASSGTHSLKITMNTSSANSFAYWGQSETVTIPVTKDVLFSINLKGVDINGNGISVLVRGDGPDGATYQYSTTEHISSITGTFEWTNYQVKLANIEADVAALSVFVVFLPGSTGTVYIDNARLVIL